MVELGSRGVSSMMYVVTSSVGGGSGGFVIVKSSESTPTMARAEAKRSFTTATDKTATREIR